MATAHRTIDELLDALWHDGVFRGDAAIVGATWMGGQGHARIAELAAFATLAALVEGEPIARPPAADPVGAAPAVCVIAYAARAWRAVRDGDAAAAADALALLEDALALADDDPRRAAAAGLADLALAECALATGDPVTARRRLRQAARRALPPGTAIAVRLSLALRAMRGGQDDPRAGLAFLDEAAQIAAGAARPIDQSIALTHAGVLAMIAGDEAGSTARLERAVAVAPAVGPSALVFARVLLAARRSDDEAFAELGGALRIAAQTGDYVAYVVLLLAGSRRAAQAGSLADAIAILDNGRAQLAALGPGASAPLDDEKGRLRAAAGDAFAAAQGDADAARARDRDRLGG